MCSKHSENLPVFTQIRCPNDRPHGKYTKCGKLLGGFSNSTVVFHCSSCGQFFEVMILDDKNVEVKPIEQKTRLTFVEGLKAIIDE